jgi:O-antigen/teichoic acid export membrane protein
LGIFFKALSWAIAFVFLAKGASKLFFWNELVGSLHGFGFSLLGYHLAGLTGLGISFLASYILYFIQVFVIAKVKFKFSFNSSLLKIFLIQFSLAVLCFAVVILVKQPYFYFIGILLIAFSVWYSYKELEKRIGIREIIQSGIQKFKRK